MARREPVTIVCVWNDPDVRTECLDASVAALLPTAPLTEYLPVDNRDQVHLSAGSALNSGVRAATNDFVAFIHQDIYLHSLQALEEAAGMLADDPTLGLVGAVGITATGELVGTMRDRVLLLGRSTGTPVEVDSLDEVLFLARRSDLLAGPVSEHPDLAWHAYAVELGMRTRASGRRVAAVDIALTHNSMSTNLARLDHAHAVLASMFPDQVPTRTTCGDVTSPTPASQTRPFLADHRWRLRWVRDSIRARRAVTASGAKQFVLADMRTDLDRVMDALDLSRIRIYNILAQGPAFPDPEGGTRLHRGHREICCSTLPADCLPDATLDDEPTLLTNLEVDQLKGLRLGGDDVLGLHEHLGLWLLTGVKVNAEAVWSSPRAHPWRLLVAHR